MSSLRSALEEWITEDADVLHVDQLADDLVELELVSGLIEAIAGWDLPYASHPPSSLWVETR